ncbi:hypothetical protein COV16_04645 [Candidatus Woesearchaeota archaeon CG10_big_fil_rev_8_21_14_0_10_34_8]|nr:MAG: hypothetical protein COV16_04645 [Candidatus Woesearchaeota archaeon CG10_big_fil_rev_8_21_14_0_10_34_8]
MNQLYQACVGYWVGELIPPHIRGIEEDLTRIRANVEADPTIGRFRTAIGLRQMLNEAPAYPEVVEVMGVWTHICVASAVADVLHRGITAVVDPDYIALPGPTSRQKRVAVLTDAVSLAFHDIRRYEIGTRSNYKTTDYGSFIMFQSE